jgi:hypothetical protein
MKFENTKVFNIDGAMRGMRNPLESWDKGDTVKDIIGENDLRLAQKLILAGSEHRKFMRQIIVSVDITAPMFWWSEFDTYKVGTVANSTSKMHRLASTPITIDCFETNIYTKHDNYFLDFIDHLEETRKAYLDTKDIYIWRMLIQELPESWLQTRTITMSYENVLSMHRQRHEHKLTEWSISFMNWIDSLPYAEELIKI